MLLALLFSFVSFSQVHASTALPAAGVFAHRGASKTHPENTLAAFREAIRQGAQGIELDLHLSKDGQLVVIHDSSVNRTTDGSGRVSSLTVQQLKTLDAGSWKGRQFRGERIPTLDEALALIPPHILINLHLKQKGIATRVAQVVLAKGITDQALIAAPGEEIPKVVAMSPKLQTINMTRESNTSYLKSTARLGATHLQFLDVRVTSADIALAHNLKVITNYCCSEKASEVRSLLEIGVDYVLVDDLAAGLSATDSLGIPRTNISFR